MKTKTLLSLVTVACATTLAHAAEPAQADKQLQVYPKNLARQHLGSNVFAFNATNQTFVPTEAAAAWLDDDVTTGWPVLAGKQYYLMAFTEPELISNFSITTRSGNGTVTLYSGDEPAAPSAKSWTLLAKEVPLDSINDKKMAKPFSRFAKYLLIETEIADPGPVYSLNVYGDKPAVSYKLQKRAASIDARAIFGQYINNQTTFNTAGLYTGGRVSYANSPDGYTAWQKLIDDNPESSLTVAASTKESGIVLDYGKDTTISRLSISNRAGSKGSLIVYAVPSSAATTGATGGAESVTPVNNPSAPVEAPAAARSAMATDGLQQIASLTIDETTTRTSIEFPSVQASKLAIAWVPATPTDSLTIRELNTFDGMSLNDYEVSLAPEAVAEFTGNPDASKDGKDFKDFKDPKALDPIAAGPMSSSPYLPGALGFPPSLTSRRVPPLPPEEPVSP